MAAKTPIRAVFTGSDATGLSEFQTGEFVDYAFGGTGLTSLGSAGQVLKINSGGTALEYGNVEAVINIDGATDLTGSTLVAGDQIILSDGGTEGRVTLSQLDTLFSGTTQTLTNKTLTSPTITGTGAIAGTFTGNITGDVTGNADTATALETARTIGGVSFDGSANINLPGVNASGNQDTSGNAATATALETARTIAGQSFDGSANITIAATDLSDTDQSLSTTDNVTFNDLVVSGDLTVSGTTTTVNTETINLADNTITLNSNATGSATENGGIEIERGDDTNKTLLWNETSDKWTVGSETFVAGTFEGALTGNVTGDVTGDVTGNLTGDVTGNVTGNLTGNVTGDVTGNLTGNVTGDVTGNADTATALATARTIGGVSFDGTANINLPGVNTTGNQDTSGNAATATALETARTIAGQSFDGTGDITIASTDLSNTSNITLNDATQTLTNKTLTSPVIATISNTGTLTLPTSTGTVALTSDIPTNNNQLTNGASYITASSTDTLTNKSGNISQWTNDAGYLTSFTETNDLTASVTWANVPDANITESSVTQHQAALSVTESQISDLQSYITATSTNTLTNKTIDASSNTISNIGNSQLIAGIDAAKISSGSVSNTEFDYLDGVTSSIQTQIDNRATKGFAIAMAIAL